MVNRGTLPSKCMTNRILIYLEILSYSFILLQLIYLELIIKNLGCQTDGP